MGDVRASIATDRNKWLEGEVGILIEVPFNRFFMGQKPSQKELGSAIINRFGDASIVDVSGDQ